MSVTPKGFVHADFFFENLVVDQNGRTSLIDFGDAYYGHPVMDATIGAMEFSALSEDKWDYEFSKTFLKPNQSFNPTDES